MCKSIWFFIHLILELVLLAQVLEIFAGLPNLRCLYLKGNPVVDAIRSYRKTVISKLPGLAYLDERPIFDMERRCAEAWCAPLYSLVIRDDDLLGAQSWRTPESGQRGPISCPACGRSLCQSFPVGV